MVGRTRIQESCARFFSRKQNFWFDQVFNGQYAGVVSQNFGFTNVVDFLYVDLVISSLSLLVSSFNVPELLAIIAGSIVSGLVPASLICRWLERTSYSVVQSVSRTLYYVDLIYEIFCKRFPLSCFGQDCAHNFRVLHGGIRSITSLFDVGFTIVMLISAYESKRKVNCVYGK